MNLDTNTYFTSLEQLGCLIIHGKDARKFLQGQVTSDMNLVSTENALPGAHCTNKGRVVFTFWIIELSNKESSENALENSDQEQAFALIIPKDMIDTANSALSKFIVFSKATIQKADQIELAGIVGKDASALANAVKNELVVISQLDNQYIIFGAKSFDSTAFESTTFDSDTFKNATFSNTAKLVQTKAQELSLTITTDENFDTWRLACIRQGIADVYHGASDLFLPQMLNFDNNQGISYKKGCYIGQEIVARMHHKGKLKRHLRRAEVIQFSQPLSVGQDIFSDNTNQSVGHIVMSAPSGTDSIECLLVVTDDAFDSQKIYLDKEKSIKLQTLSLPYAINN